jgi:hypothetical protein
MANNDKHSSFFSIYLQLHRELVHIHKSFSVYLTNGPNKLLHYTRLEKLAKDKHSSLLGPFKIYVENEVFRLWPLGLTLHNLFRS